MKNKMKKDLRHHHSTLLINLLRTSVVLQVTVGQAFRHLTGK